LYFHNDIVLTLLGDFAKPFLLFAKALGVCRNSFLVFVSDGINLDSLKI
jgi:hypothetical protein